MENNMKSDTLEIVSDAHSVTPGNALLFEVANCNIDAAETEINWSLAEDDLDESTEITADGVLIVSAIDQGKTITVVATAAADPSVTGTFEVAVSELEIKLVPSVWLQTHQEKDTYSILQFTDTGEVIYSEFNTNDGLEEELFMRGTYTVLENDAIIISGMGADDGAYTYQIDDIYLRLAGSDVLAGTWMYILDDETKDGGNTLFMTGATNSGYADWMSGISDEWRLSDLCIPGTHDSATSRMPSYATRDYAITQNRTIDEQLNDGIRFLDLRVGANGNVKHGSNNRLDLWHGDAPWEYYCGVSFEETLRTITAFLYNHPKEMVIVSIKSENHKAGTPFIDMLMPYLNNANYPWFKENRVPNLKEVRGKIVLFRRFDYNGTLGLDLRAGWKDNDPSEIGNGHMTTIIQDCYSVYDWKSSVAKRADRKAFWINKYIDIINQHRGNVLGINFWSHSFSLGAGPETYAKAVNAAMRNSINNNFRNKRSYGIFPMDYYWQEYVAAMIESNYRNP